MSQQDNIVIDLASAEIQKSELTLRNPPGAHPLRVLLIEDDSTEADLLSATLKHVNLPPIDLHWSRLLSESLEQLAKQHFDIILLDLSLPDSHSTEALRKVREVARLTPIIILTALDNRAVALDALKEGAQDYLIKGKASGESIYRAMSYAIEGKRAEALILKSVCETKEAQNQLKLALLTSEIGVFSWDITGDRILFDQQGLKLFGFDLNELRCTYDVFLQRIHPDDRARVNEAVTACLNGKEEYHIEYRIVWPDGTQHVAVVMGTTFFDEKFQPVKLVGVCRDITKDKQEEERTRRLALLEQRQEFTAMLAHDLRTPIIGCQSILENMLKGALGPVTDSQKDVLSKVCSSNRSLLLMIRNVMDSYRLESGAECFGCTEVDMPTLISECIEETQPLARSQNISMVCSVTQMKPAFADAIAMRRVVSNLITNALKYTPAHGSIEVAALERDGKAVVQVKDTGIGISTDNIEKVFQRFWQAENTFKASGLGLGLYLCRKLVEAQHGTITCTSQLGCGSTFEVTLPLAEESTNKREPKPVPTNLG